MSSSTELAAATGTHTPTPAHARSVRRRPRVNARKWIFGIVVVALWQAYTSFTNVDPLLFPAPWEVARTLVTDWGDGSLATATLSTLKTLLIGIGIGAVLAIVLAVAAVWTRIGANFLDFFASIFNPLPGIAVLPLAILWFGLNSTALVFVLVNAVVWPLSYNLRTGFDAISPTIRAVSKNIGLRGWRELVYVLTPGALPYIMAGIRTAWAFGWRTVVAAELVFGVAGSGGGLGTYLNEAQYFLRTTQVFAGLVTIAVIGVLLEIVFARIERLTIRRWGMSSAA